jgi:hypothetical protein
MPPKSDIPNPKSNNFSFKRSVYKHKDVRQMTILNYFNHIFRQGFFLKIMVKQTLIAFLIIPILGFLTPIFGQKPVTIKLENPSFEDSAWAARTPKGWFDCGYAGESPPDVQPGHFGVNRLAFHDSTYLGMVVRDNNTWEGVGQQLKTPLLKDVKYSFSLYLCRSEFYNSQSQTTGKDANFNTPAIIRMWGGSGYCAKEEFLAESQLIESTDWEKVNFILKPKANYSYFFIEAFYKIPTLFPYNGNVLVDNASAIVPILDKN